MVCHVRLNPIFTYNVFPKTIFIPICNDLNLCTYSPSVIMDLYLAVSSGADRCGRIVAYCHDALPCFPASESSSSDSPMDLFSLGDGLVHSVFIGKLIFSHAKENYVKNFKNLLSKKTFWLSDCMYLVFSQLLTCLQGVVSDKTPTL